MKAAASDVARRHALVDEAIALRPALLRQARRFAGPAAEDVLQDVCLRLLDLDGPPLAPADTPRAFIMHMTRNAAIDRARRARFEVRTFAPEEDAGCHAATGACPFERLACRQALCAVAEALEGLRPRTRAVFCRARVDGVPQNAVAREFGVSTALVCELVRRAHAPCAEAAARAGLDAPKRRRIIRRASAQDASSAAALAESTPSSPH